MSSVREKERRKEQQDKFQAILSALLKDEDNKYCVDCDAKGPRWASWNLGIFLCIRCAGIHRNLGVHISRVKSVNLDTWTPEQVAMMQEIGNSRARAAYEANLPDGYRRPQTDSALESFVRAKYEHKKYMAREWVPPQPKVPKEWLEDKTEKKKTKPKQASTVKLTSVPKSISPVDTGKPQQPVQKTEVTLPNSTEAKVNSLADDLLGLDLTPPQTNVQQPPSAPAPSGSNDLLELFGGPQPAQNNTATPATSQVPNQTNTAVNGSATSEGNLFGEDADVGDKKASTKDSIMALFGGSSSQPQMYGVPGGMYIPQNQQGYSGVMPQQSMMGPQPQGMIGQQPQGMMGQQTQGMMGQQNQGMMGQQPQGMMGQQTQGMIGQQTQGMMGQQPQGMMGQQPQGMMGQQTQGMMGQQNLMGSQQGMMGMVGQQQGMVGQPSGMMGNAMMNGSQHSGMFQGQGQVMMGNTGMYAPQQMQQQQLQYQQMQQSMPKNTNNWGNPTGQTLSNNLWQ